MQASHLALAQAPGLARPLILGSTSRYRRELLERLQLPFQTVSLEADGECATGMPRVDHVERHGIRTFLQGLAGTQNDAINGHQRTSQAWIPALTRA